MRNVDYFAAVWALPAPATKRRAIGACNPVVPSRSSSSILVFELPTRCRHSFAHDTKALRHSWRRGLLREIVGAAGQLLNFLSLGSEAGKQDCGGSLMQINPNGFA